MGWNEANKAAEESGGGLFLQLKDRDIKQVVVMGEPVHFFQIFGDKTNKEYATKVPNSSFRFKVQVVEIHGSNLEGKLWSGGKTIFERLVYLHQNMDGIHNKILTVARKGSTKDDTVYNIDIKTTLPPEKVEQIKAIKLPPMERKESNDEIPLPDEEVPF